MEECWIRDLSNRRGEIHRRWEALLRLERADTPLADPNTLVHLIDWTIDKVLFELGKKRPRRAGDPRPSVGALRGICQCGRNPFYMHFLAGEQALLEALVLAQSQDPLIDPVHRDTMVAELYAATSSIARFEIESFCSLCQHRPPAAQKPVAAGAVHN